MDWDKIKPELEKKLDPKHVKPPKKFGPKGDYIEGWHAIAEANRLFGFGGWSYTIALSRDDVREGKDSNGNPQWQAAYTCVCTVTVGDVVRQDVGFGSGFAKGLGDAIEGATKEAATDALKRCLRTFGNAFGLALYDKERSSVGVDYDPAPSAALIKEAIGNAGTMGRLIEVWKGQAAELKRIEAAAPETFTELVAFKDWRKQQLDPAMQAPKEAAE